MDGTYGLVIDTISVAVQLIAVIDPIGAVPLLFNVPDYDKRVRSISRLIGIAVPVILLIFALLGPYILSAFGININDFKIAGGIILLVVAIDILRGGTSSTVPINPDDYILVPIVTPLLVGPGAITAAMIYMTYYSAAVVILGIAIASAITYMTVRYSTILVKIMGQSMLKMVGRFFSLIIASWAIQLIVEGVTHVI
ncbi:antibiotic resistance protein MarC [Thermocladium modestius]|uniref:UPF0056 membrane protein n=1 Tax=Thermocladium modestius TaxID=62609 RepID=A0A830GUR5_9CREN|nr:MarC family protein [Thermocladium modestius]GGP19944.1 antibiotic resistance protein MarC [Thermocladium modestius]